MIAGLLGAELPGKPLGAEERRHTHHYVPLSLRVLSFIQLCVAGRQDRPSRELSVASEIAGESAVQGFDGLAIAVEEIIGKTELKGRSRIGAIKAKRAFNPGQSLRRSARPHQDAAPRQKAVSVARIDLESALGLPQGKIETTPSHMDLGEQAVG